MNWIPEVRIMTEKYRNPLLYIEVIGSFFNEGGMRYEPINQISFLYQPERGPKREYQNIVTLFKRCRITVVIRSFGTLAKNP